MRRILKGILKYKNLIIKIKKNRFGQENKNNN